MPEPSDADWPARATAACASALGDCCPCPMGRVAELPSARTDPHRHQARRLAGAVDGFRHGRPAHDFEPWPPDSRLARARGPAGTLHRSPRPPWGTIRHDESAPRLHHQPPLRQQVVARAAPRPSSRPRHAPARTPTAARPLLVARSVLEARTEAVRRRAHLRTPNPAGERSVVPAIEGRRRDSRHSPPATVR